jgi:hypothetical protein
MFVEGLNRGGPQWRYAAGPGFEVLSCCEDDTTEDFLTRTLEQRALLGELVPPRFQRQTAAPNQLILLSEDFAGSVSAEMRAELRRNGERRGGSAYSGAAIRSLPQLRLSESDSDMSYFILGDHQAVPAEARQQAESVGGGGWVDENYGGLRLSPEFVSHLIADRAPTPPAWFIAGAVQIYQSSRLYPDFVVMDPGGWGSERQTERLREDFRAPRCLLPMTEFFDPRSSLPSDPAANLAYRRVWFDQAALFYRWALEGPDAARRAAFWRWAGAEGPARHSEAFFRACFGLGWADLRDRLSDYLPTAVDRVVRWRPAIKLADGPIHLHRASPDEIRRLQGEWARREVPFIREHHPELAAHYIERARLTLNRAYADGDRDPRLLASLGLLAAETGETAAAAPFLAAAVAGGVVRPRAGDELARERLAQFEGAGADWAVPLTAQQSAEVWALLGRTLAEPPPQREAYLLLAELMRLSVGPPPPEWRAALVAGAGLFPEVPGLARAAALWELRAGDRTEALRLVELGLEAAPSEAVRAPLSALRQRLVRTALPGASASTGPAEPDPWSALAAMAGPDPRDRRDLGLAPDGRHFAYLAPFGGRPDRLVILDLESTEPPLTIRLRRPNDLKSSTGARSHGAPQLAWTSAGRIVVTFDEQAAWVVDANGTKRTWLAPGDPEFIPPAPPVAADRIVLDRRTGRQVGARSPTAYARTYWSDPELASLQAGLERKLPGRRVALLDWDSARTRILAVAQTPDGKGRCFVFRRPENLLMEIPLEGPPG